MFDAEVGSIALDQEKVFDQVDQNYLFNLLVDFEFSQGFIKWIQLLYTRASCMVKVWSSLSQPILVSRGIRHGCPLSVQL